MEWGRRECDPGAAMGPMGSVSRQRAGRVRVPGVAARWPGDDWIGTRRPSAPQQPGRGPRSARPRGGRRRRAAEIRAPPGLTAARPAAPPSHRGSARRRPRLHTARAPTGEGGGSGGGAFDGGGEEGGRRHGARGVMADAGDPTCFFRTAARPMLRAFWVAPSPRWLGWRHQPNRRWAPPCPAPGAPARPRGGGGGGGGARGRRPARPARGVPRPAGPRPRRRRAAAPRARAVTSAPRRALGAGEPHRPRPAATPHALTRARVFSRPSRGLPRTPGPPRGPARRYSILHSRYDTLYAAAHPRTRNNGPLPHGVAGPRPKSAADAQWPAAG
jgi:hypothetical protein